MWKWVNHQASSCSLGCVVYRAGSKTQIDTEKERWWHHQRKFDNSADSDNDQDKNESFNHRPSEHQRATGNGHGLNLYAGILRLQVTQQRQIVSDLQVTTSDLNHQQSPRSLQDPQKSGKTCNKTRATEKHQGQQGHLNYNLKQKRSTACLQRPTRPKWWWEHISSSFMSFDI